MRPLDVLIVEDNPGDAKLYRKVLLQVDPSARLNFLADGDAALAYLRKLPPHRDAARPDLMLIDLNLPRRDGRELLREIKSDASLKTIPILVVTSSEEETDILRSYDLHANCYLTKPLNLDEFLRTLHTAATFWLCVARLPARE